VASNLRLDAKEIGVSTLLYTCPARITSEGEEAADEDDEEEEEDATD
jgi:hypothetical protein